MFSKGWQRSSLMKEISRDCEYLLVEAAIGFARDRDWKVQGYLGKEYRVALTVDEWTDSPLIEVRDAESGKVVKHVEIMVMCWPKRER
jgi:hypothetical protein